MVSGPRLPDPSGPPRHQGRRDPGPPPPPPPRRPGGGPPQPSADPGQRTVDAPKWWQQIPKGRPTPPHLAYQPPPPQPPPPRRPSRPFGPPPARMRPPPPPVGMRPQPPPAPVRPQSAPPDWLQPAGAAEARRSSGRPLLVAAGVTGGIVLAVFVALGMHGLAPSGAPELDVEQAQAGVLQVLTDPVDGYGRDDVSDVRCNDGRNPTIRKGATFTCSVDVGGAGRQVTVLFPDGTGSYEVDRPR